ncbi:MAG: DUF2950 family protein [Gammaproteobacteria bacterium]
MLVFYSRDRGPIHLQNGGYPISPLGPLVAQAIAEDFSTAKTGKPIPYHRYYHKILTRQGKLSEDIDPATGELWGSSPQTYSMVGLIVKTWEEAFWRNW